MTLHLMLEDGQSREYKHVAYFSVYPYKPEPIVRVEFKDDMYPVMTRTLVDVSNLWVRENES